MGLKAYDVPAGGLVDGAVMTPSNDINFVWKRLPMDELMANITSINFNGLFYKFVGVFR